MALVHDDLNVATGVRIVTVDNGDGTGTRTTYDAEGNETGTENLTGLPIPVDPPPTVEEQLAEVTAALEALAGGGE